MLFRKLGDGEVPDDLSEEQVKELYDFLPDRALHGRLFYHVRRSVVRCEVKVEGEDSFAGMTIEVPESLLDPTISRVAALKNIATRTSELYNARIVDYLFNPTHWTNGRSAGENGAEAMVSHVRYSKDGRLNHEYVHSFKPSSLNVEQLSQACSQDQRLGAVAWKEAIRAGTEPRVCSAQVEFERAPLTIDSIRSKTEELTKQLNDRLLAEVETRRDHPLIKTGISDDIMNRLREKFSEAWASEDFDHQSWETTFDIVPVIIDRDVKDPKDPDALSVHEDLVTISAVPSDLTLEQVWPKPYGSK